MSIDNPDIDLEQQEWDQEIAAIEEWWHTPRQQHIKRPYSAAKIAAMRSSLHVEYPASQQALKLWHILNEHRDRGTAELTFGMIDPILASQMEGQGTVYVSGALCAFSVADCAGQDTSDYPWDTVPKTADRLFRSQIYHDRRQRQDRLRRSKEERAKLLPARDYLLPIVADGDMGFGTPSATAKLTQRMVEAGVAMFHIDDLALGMKRWTSGYSSTVASTSEYLRRLGAARIQLDIMGAETLLMCRCDVGDAEFITSNNDQRDHAYILGATVPIEPLAEVLKAVRTDDIEERQSITKRWKERACLMTFDDAVKKASSESQFTQYKKLASEEPFPSLMQRRKYAEDALGGSQIFFDWELPRLEDGRYHFAPSVQTILERCLAAAPFGDVTWARMNLIWDNLVRFHESFRKIHPERLFAAGYSATFDFNKNGYSDDHVREFHHRLAKMGIVWQVQPGFAMQGLNFVTHNFSKLWAKEGIAGYVREIQEPAMKVDTDGYEKMAWSGGYLADAYTDLLVHI